MSIFISNDLDTDIDIETHDNSHLIKFNQILVENDLHIGSKCWSWPCIRKQISEMSSSAQLCIQKLYRRAYMTYDLLVNKLNFLLISSFFDAN